MYKCFGFLGSLKDPLYCSINVPLTVFLCLNVEEFENYINHGALKIYRVEYEEGYV